MGIMDVVNPENTVELKISQLMSILENNAKLKAQNDIYLTGYKKKIKHDTVLALLNEENEKEVQNGSKKD